MSAPHTAALADALAAALTPSPYGHAISVQVSVPAWDRGGRPAHYIVTAYSAPDVSFCGDAPTAVEALGEAMRALRTVAGRQA